MKYYHHSQKCSSRAFYLVIVLRSQFLNQISGSANDLVRRLKKNMRASEREEKN